MRCPRALGATRSRRKSLDPGQWAWGKIFAGKSRTSMPDISPSPTRGHRKGGMTGGCSAPTSSGRSLSPEDLPGHHPGRGGATAGALFSEALDLSFGRLNFQLLLEKCRFEKAVNLEGLRIDGWLSLCGSAIVEEDTGPGLAADFQSVDIRGFFSMENATFRGGVPPRGCHGHRPLGPTRRPGRGDAEDERAQGRTELGHAGRGSKSTHLHEGRGPPGRQDHSQSGPVRRPGRGRAEDEWAPGRGPEPDRWEPLLKDVDLRGAKISHNLEPERRPGRGRAEHEWAPGQAGPVHVGNRPAPQPPS